MGAFDDLIPRGAFDDLIPQKKKARTWTEAIADTGVQLAEGGVNIVKAPVDLLAPESGVAQTLQGAGDYLRDKQSDALKDRIATAESRIKAAGEAGAWEELKAAVAEYATDPALAARFAVTNFASLVPGLGAAKLAQLAAIAKGATAAKAATAATAAAMGTNAVLNAGGARGDAFDELKQAHIAQGKSPEEAERLAIEQSRLAASIGGATGLVSGGTGLERALFAKGGATGLVRAAAGKKGAAAAGAELGGELVEEVTPQAATNVQLSEIDGRPIMRGLPTTAVQTVLGAGPFAAGAGAKAYSDARAEPPGVPPVAPGAPPDATPVAPTSTAQPGPAATPPAPAAQAADPLVRLAELELVSGERALTPQEKVEVDELILSFDLAEQTGPEVSQAQPVVATAAPEQVVEPTTTPAEIVAPAPAIAPAPVDTLVDTPVAAAPIPIPVQKTALRNEATRLETAALAQLEQRGTGDELTANMEQAQRLMAEADQLRAKARELRPVAVVTPETPAEPITRPRVHKTKAAADKAKAGNTERVQKVKGGFILRQATDKELAAAERNGARLAAGAQVDTDNDSLLTAIAKLGGIQMSEIPETIGEGNKQIGGKWLFTKGGRPLDTMASEILRELGYVPKAEVDAGTDVKWLRDAIRSEHMGTKAHFSENSTGWMEAAAAQHAEEQGSDAALEDFTLEELDEAGYSRAAPEVQAATEELLAAAEDLGIDTDALKERAVKATEGQSDAAYHAELQTLASEAIAAAREDIGNAEARAVGRSAQDFSEVDGDTGPAQEVAPSEEPKAAQTKPAGRAPAPFDPKTTEFTVGKTPWRITVRRYWTIPIVAAPHDPDTLVWSAERGLPVTSSRANYTEWTEVRGDDVPIAVARKASDFFESIANPSQGDFELTAQTPAELRAQAARDEAAQQAKDKAERDLANREEADRQAKNFGLTGSDRAADVGAAAGQQDMGAPAAEKPAAKPSRGPAASEAWKNEGKTPAQLVEEKAVRLGDELAAQIVSDAREAAFDAKDLPRAVEQWAKDGDVPADSVRLAVVSAVQRAALPNAIKTKIRNALNPAKNAAAKTPATSADLGLRNMAQRSELAREKFIESTNEQFGLTRAQAIAAFDGLLKAKILTVDHVGGQFTLKNGSAWDKDVLLRAAGIAPSSDGAQRSDGVSALFQVALEASKRGPGALSDFLSRDTFLGDLDQLLKIPSDAGARSHSAQLVDAGAATSKRRLDGVRGHAQALSDILKIQAVANHGAGDLDIKTQRLVLPHVLALSKNSQVLQTVVSLIPIDVVNDLSALELSAESLFNDAPMVKLALAKDLSDSVPRIGNTPDALVRALALAGAEVSSAGVVSDLIGPSQHLGAAGRTQNSDLGHGANGTRDDGFAQTTGENGNVAMFNRVANEPGQAENQPYDTDLFGNPLPQRAGTPPAAAPARPAVDGLIRSKPTVPGDTQAPAGEYYVNTIVGRHTQRHLGAPLITSSAELAQATQYLSRSAVERFDAIVTDAAGKPLAVVGGFKGAIAHATVENSVIVAEAVRVPGAAKVWFTHNHPSGTPKLSDDDKKIHDRLVRVLRGSGVEPQALIAIGAGEFSSTDGTSGAIASASAKQTVVDVVERELGPEGVVQTEKIASATIAKEMAKALYDRAQQPGIALLNTQRRLAAWVPIDTTMSSNLRDTGGLNAIFRAISQSNAHGAILVHSGELDQRMVQGITVGENIAAALESAGVEPLDSVNIKNPRSLAEQGGYIAAGPVYLRGEQATTGLPVTTVQQVAEHVMSTWVNRPKLQVLESMDDAPEPVRVAYEKQNAEGAKGKAAAFMYGDTMYLVRSDLSTPGQVATAVLHEGIGHYGLRGAFGSSLNPILDQLAIARPDLVRERASHYGLDMSKVGERRQAAEEALAKMAQTNPTSGYVKRAIAAIKEWLRANIPFFKDLKLTDADIVQMFLVPAQDFVRRGQGASAGQLSPAFGRKSPPFYSALTRAVEAATMKSAPAQGWRDFLKGQIAKGAIKADEVAWSGLDDWLGMIADTKPGFEADLIAEGHMLSPADKKRIAANPGIAGAQKITRDQIAEFLHANGVQISETVLSGVDPNTVKDGYLDAMERQGESQESAREMWVNMWMFATDREFDENSKDKGFALVMADGLFTGNEIHDAAAGDSDTKYGDRVLPGGTNYREVLLTLPARGALGRTLATRKAIFDRYAPQIEEAHRRSGDMSLSSEERREASRDYEMLVDNRDIEAATKGGEVEPGQLFQTGHFDQPNILAHVRVNDRTTQADGFVVRNTRSGNKSEVFATRSEAEVYQQQLPASLTTEITLAPRNQRVLFVEEIQSDWAQKGRKKNSVGSMVGFATGKEAGNFSQFAARAGVSPSEMQRIFDNQNNLTGADADLWARWSEERDRGATGIPTAPFVTNTDKWLALALKRIVTMAVEGGYDKVAFINGEQSADRYDLSRHLKALRWGRTKDGSYSIGFMSHKNSTPYFDDAGIHSAKDLPDVVGKEMADRIINSKEDTGEYNGLDLKVGGTGMVAFYDQIVPAALKKVLKSVGGDGLTTAKMLTNPADGGGTPMRGAEYITSPAFTITDAMRAKAADGLPMFARSTSQTDTAAFKTWFGNSKVVDANGAPLVVYHGTVRDFAQFDKNKKGTTDHGWYGLGAGYFTADQDTASSYSVYRDMDSGLGFGPLHDSSANAGANVMPVYLALANPYVWPEGRKAATTKAEAQTITDELKAQGFDGIIVPNKYATGEAAKFYEIVAFSPDQVKSATGNNGNFDPSNPNINFSRTQDTGPATAYTRDTSPAAGKDVKALNDALVRYGLGESWRNAYEAVELPDALSGIGKEIQAAFGRDVRPVAPTHSAFDQFDGIYIPSQPNTLYVNVAGKVDFIRIAGHELWHTIRQARPDLVSWYRQQSGAYLRNLPEYQTKLNALLQPGETVYNADKALEELEADFLGDSLADPVFLQSLVDSSPTKFKALMMVVQRWLAKTLDRMKSLGSERYVTDVRALQDHLRDVMVAFAEGRPIGPSQSNTPAFSRAQIFTDAFKAWFKGSKVVDENGKPLVVYHGTRSDIQKVDEGKSERLPGFWMTTDPKQANAYAAEGVANALSYPEGANVLPLFAKIEKPYYYNPKKKPMQMAWQEYQDGDYDGFIETDVKSKRITSLAVRSGDQIKSAISNTGAFDASNPSIMFARTTLANTAPPQIPVWQQNSWQKLKAKTEKLIGGDGFLYEFQDKFIDLKRVRDRIVELKGVIADQADAYLGELLYHGRVAKRTETFLSDEIKPLLAHLQTAGVSMQELEQFAHARHAPEANAAMALRNPNQAMIDAGQAQSAADVTALEHQLQTAQAAGTATKTLEKALELAKEERARWDRSQAFKGTEAERLSLSGMSDSDAAAHMASLPAGKRVHLDALALRLDAINSKTLDALESYGLQDKATIAAWRAEYKFYVPLHRDEAHPDGGSHPIGTGYATRGSGTHARVGSNEKVTNILGHIAMQREAALTRGEKALVGKRLYLMARSNPDPDFWSVDQKPMVRTIDPATGFAYTHINPRYKDLKNILMVRIGGKDVAIVFNEHNDRAVRLAGALKNLDVSDMHIALSVVAKGTRWFASINTQYNPIFGITNLARDVQFAALSLATTPIAGKKAEVLGNIPQAMRAIYRAERGKGVKNAEWTRLWKEFQLIGGQTGYRDMFVKPDERADALRKGLAELNRGQVGKAAHAVVDILSDYNTAMENSTRLAAYKAGLDAGMSKERAAAMAKDLTVNFNRKGASTREIGALYAFFNASVQGTTRMVQTLRGPTGKKIMLGGVLLGAANTMLGMLLMGGGDDDEWEKIPVFIKERNIIIPTSRTTYISIPMPLGYHVLPNIGRLAAEWAFGPPEKTGAKQIGELFMVVADAFNPMGGAQTALQLVSPTVFDPAVALGENKDWTGRQIFRENNRPLDPTPGHARTKDSASTPAKLVSRGINSLTGGTEYRPGGISWTPDQIDYVVGQVFGGVGRELIKLNQFAAAPFTGDEIPAHKVPLLGRFYGDTSGPTGQSGRFYENVKELNEIENELRGRARDKEDVAGFLRDEPKTKLIGLGNGVEKQVTDLRKYRQAIVKAGLPGYQEQAKQVEVRITEAMKLLNQRMRAAAE